MDRARSEAMPALAGVVVAPLTLAETLAAVEDMLRGIASGQPLDRNAASHYTDWRLRLLQSDLAPLLPGFLYQCVSLHRFKDFITLYDPDVDHRQRFLGRTLSGARDALGLEEPAETVAAASPVRAAATGPVADPARSSAHWMR